MFVFGPRPAGLGLALVLFQLPCRMFLILYHKTAK